MMQFSGDHERRCVGLQFHLETTVQSVAPIGPSCRHELTEGPYVQSGAALRAVTATAGARAGLLMA